MATSAGFKYKRLKAHVKYMKAHVMECQKDLNIYSALSEYEYSLIKDYIGHPKVVLELGCGLGRASIYLNHMLQDPDTYFILADTTGWTITDRQDYGGYDVTEYYNDLLLTASFAMTNGLDNFDILDLPKTGLGHLHDVDLVLSCCAFGMHFPIEPIMPELLSVTTDDCTMIFGTRNRAVYSQESFKDLFNLRYFLPQQQNDLFPQEDWLILKEKVK